MTIEMTRTFFGWCTVINLGLFMLSAILLIAIRGMAARMHAKMFNVSEEFILQTYYKYLGYYKIGIIIFNVVPYFALKIMAG